MNYKFYHNLVAGVEAESRQRSRPQVAGAAAMNPTEQAVDAALREAYENGFNAAREAAARVCDRDARLWARSDYEPESSALSLAAARIRALKSKEPQQ